MIRKLIVSVKRIVGGRRSILLPVVVWGLLVVVCVCWLQQASRALLPPAPPDQNLEHFRRSRDLSHYLDNIGVLIEPSSVCDGDVPLLVLVSSAPAHAEQRAAIRSTWGKHLPTYFVLGLAGLKLDGNLADTYVEAKLHSDLIVFDMADHYQNLTLKTMLMLQWTSSRCEHAEWLFKTDDDVLVNPWMLQKVLEEHVQAKVLGYRISGSKLHRDEYTKWFVPRWLHHDDVVREYVSGTGYLIRGSCIEDILKAAKKIPLINLEDVYLTYLVSKSSLGLNLTHERRLSPYRPWLPTDCAYFNLASMHSLTPDEISHAWPKIERKGKEFEANTEVCMVHNKYFDSDWTLY